MPDGFPPELLRATPPGIDPLDPRNLELAPRLPGRVLRPLGVDLDRPFCLQLLRARPLERPALRRRGLRLAREEQPELQLVLAAQLDSTASEEWRAAKEVSDYAGDTPGVLLLTCYESLGSLELGAPSAPRARGAGALAVARASASGPRRRSGSGRRWSAAPAAACRCPSATAWTASSPTTPEHDGGPARRAGPRPGLAVEMGRAGRERVREQFLVTRAARARAAPRRGAALRVDTVERP